MEDAWHEAPVDAVMLDKPQGGTRVVGLGADEHGTPVVTPPFSLSRHAMARVIWVMV